MSGPRPLDRFPPVQPPPWIKKSSGVGLVDSAFQKCRTFFLCGPYFTSAIVGGSGYASIATGLVVGLEAGVAGFSAAMTGAANATADIKRALSNFMGTPKRYGCLTRDIYSYRYLEESWN